MENTQTQMAEAITSTAKLYEAVEKVLRRYTDQGQWATLRTIFNAPEIQEMDVPMHKVRYTVDTFRHYGNVRVDKYSDGREHYYMWDAKAPPFVLGRKSSRHEARKPSKPTIIKGENGTHEIHHDEPHFTQLAEEMLPKKAEPKTESSELELVFGSTTIVVNGPSVTVSRNAGTGRVRIEIEQ
jgi:hypothetical protein